MGIIFTMASQRSTNAPLKRDTEYAYEQTLIRGADYVYTMQTSLLSTDLRQYPKLKPELYRLLDIELRKLEEKYPWKQDGTLSEVTLSVQAVLDNIGYRHRWSNGNDAPKGKGEPCIGALINIIILEVIPRLERKGYNASFEDSCALVISVRVERAKQSVLSVRDSTTLAQHAQTGDAERGNIVGSGWGYVDAAAIATPVRP